MILVITRSPVRIIRILGKTSRNKVPMAWERKALEGPHGTRRARWPHVLPKPTAEANKKNKMSQMNQKNKTRTNRKNKTNRKNSQQDEQDEQDKNLAQASWSAVCEDA